MEQQVKKKETGEQRQVQPNRTGIPSRMKLEFESRSGLSLDGVRVHYNSPHPQSLNARAYTDGQNIFLGPRQEPCLRHELGHIIQRSRRSVEPTCTVAGCPVNDSPELEREADRLAAAPGPFAGGTSPIQAGCIQRLSFRGEEGSWAEVARKLGAKEKIDFRRSLQAAAAAWQRKELENLLRESNEEDRGFPWPSETEAEKITETNETEAEEITETNETEVGEIAELSETEAGKDTELSEAAKEITDLSEAEAEEVKSLDFEKYYEGINPNLKDKNFWINYESYATGDLTSLSAAVIGNPYHGIAMRWNKIGEYDKDKNLEVLRQFLGGKRDEDGIVTDIGLQGIWRESETSNAQKEEGDYYRMETAGLHFFEAQKIWAHMEERGDTTAGELKEIFADLAKASVESLWTDQSEDSQEKPKVEYSKVIECLKNRKNNVDVVNFITKLTNNIHIEVYQNLSEMTREIAKANDIVARRPAAAEIADIPLQIAEKVYQSLSGIAAEINPNKTVADCLQIAEKVYQDLSGMEAEIAAAKTAADPWKLETEVGRRLNQLGEKIKQAQNAANKWKKLSEREKRIDARDVNTPLQNAEEIYSKLVEIKEKIAAAKAEGSPLQSVKEVHRNLDKINEEIAAAKAEGSPLQRVEEVHRNPTEMNKKKAAAKAEGKSLKIVRNVCSKLVEVKEELAVVQTVDDTSLEIKVEMCKYLDEIKEKIAAVKTAVAPLKITAEVYSCLEKLEKDTKAAAAPGIAADEHQGQDGQEKKEKDTEAAIAPLEIAKDLHWISMFFRYVKEFQTMGRKQRTELVPQNIPMKRGFTEGTQLVAIGWNQQRRQALRKAWGVESAGEKYPYDTHITEWLVGRGVKVSAHVTNQPVAVLWVRTSGSNGGAHYENDTSFTYLAYKAFDCLNDGYTVFLAGDNKEKKAENLAKRRKKIYNITKFWADDGSGKAQAQRLKDWGGNTRTGQFRLYDYLKRNARSLIHIGAMSGNVEAMALLGHSVEAHVNLYSDQGVSRMRAYEWHDQVIENAEDKISYDIKENHFYERKDAADYVKLRGKSKKIYEIIRQRDPDTIENKIPQCPYNIFDAEHNPFLEERKGMDNHKRQILAYLWVDGLIHNKDYNDVWARLNIEHPGMPKQEFQKQYEMAKEHITKVVEFLKDKKVQAAIGINTSGEQDTRGNVCDKLQEQLLNYIFIRVVKEQTP